MKVFWTISTVQHTLLKLLLMKSYMYIVHKPMVALKVFDFEVLEKKTFCGLKSSKLKAAHPVRFFLDFWEKIQKIAHPVRLFLFTSLSLMRIQGAKPQKRQTFIFKARESNHSPPLFS